jgi:hypothetical protein
MNTPDFFPYYIEFPKCIEFVPVFQWLSLTIGFSRKSLFGRCLKLSYLKRGSSSFIIDSNFLMKASPNKGAAGDCNYKKTI